MLWARSLQQGTGYAIALRSTPPLLLMLHYFHAAMHEVMGVLCMYHGLDALTVRPKRTHFAGTAVTSAHTACAIAAPAQGTRAASDRPARRPRRSSWTGSASCWACRRPSWRSARAARAGAAAA